MSQLFNQLVERVRELPETQQDFLAVELKSVVDQMDNSDIQLSDEQLAELDRRLAEKNPKFLTQKEFEEQLKEVGVLWN